MGLSLLAPLFLAALAGIAIPVLIHLTRRPKDKVVLFPSLAFLRRIPYRSIRRRKIRHWWLLALRAGLVAALAIAFARPFMQSAGADDVTRGPRDVAILLDHSLSMAYGDRWSRALSEARGAIGGLSGGDRGAVVLFSDRAAVVAGPTEDRATLLASLEDLRPGHGATRLGSAVGLAAELLANPRGRAEVVLISDLQRTGLADAEDARLPAGARLTVTNVGGDVPANLAVPEVAVERLADRDRERIAVSARVVNTGSEAVRGVPVYVELNGARVATQTADLPARGAASVRFDRIAAPMTAARLVVTAGDDPLPADNVHRAVLHPAPPVLVAVFANNARRSLFARRALELGTEPRFALRTRVADAFRPGDLEDVRVALFLDPPPAAASTTLGAFIRRGGGVLVAGSGAPLFSRAAGAVVDRITDNGGRLTAPNFDHPVFEVFRGPRSGDLSAARFFRYRRTVPAQVGAAVLARFDDGTAALLEQRVEPGGGAGRVLWWTSSLDDSWTDFPVQPVFLPFIHQVTRYLAAYEAPPPAHTIGEPLDVRRVPGLAAATEVVIESPSGRRTPWRATGGSAGVELSEPGYYTLRPVGAGGGAGAAAVAVNPEPGESDLAAVDPSELERRLVPVEGGPAAAALAATLTPAERERRQGLWWYLLVGVLSALLAESVLANRLPVSSEVIR